MWPTVRHSPNPQVTRGRELTSKELLNLKEPGEPWSGLQPPKQNRVEITLGGSTLPLGLGLCSPHKLTTFLPAEAHTSDSFSITIVLNVLNSPRPFSVVIIKTGAVDVTWPGLPPPTHEL